MQVFYFILFYLYGGLKGHNNLSKCLFLKNNPAKFHPKMTEPLASLKKVAPTRTTTKRQVAIWDQFLIEKINGTVGAPAL